MYDGDALPLLANSDAIKVDQYVFQWTLSTRTRSLSGALLLRLRIGSSTEKEQISCCTGDISDRPKSEQSTRAPFVFVLDAFELDIGQVVASEEYLDVIPCLCEAAEGLKRLSFAVDEWSLRIWDRTVFHVKDFPPCVIIYYSTRVSGSLRWTTDANGDNLVYTPGVLVNNRGLLPCQDGPAVLATWTAMVSLDGFEEDIRVFMTGDTESRLQLPAESAGNGSSSALCWYFSNTDPAPVSTLGLLIGKFDVRHPRSSQFAWQLSPRCCVVSTPKQWKKGSITPRQLFEYVEAALQVTDKVLGKYPFPKLDIWITPATYESLGMAWPNLIYLHPAVLAEDGGMWVRIAHEISHAWYGLSIGQTDWSEEWMSEGFATYLEDIIHVRTMNKLYNWTEAAADRWIDPRMLTKYRQLCDQVENISQDLQVLQQPTVPGGVANGLNRPNCQCKFIILRDISF